MKNRPSGFEYALVGNDVVITHQGRRATTLRGPAADQFLAAANGGAAQELMARVTGNYKHGNERIAKNHPRNRGRKVRPNPLSIQDCPANNGSQRLETV
ncbi:MAG: hypothetical protein ABI137_15295 [Antricoccus sp.]